MRTSTGFFDSLFGKRIKLEIPLPDGTTKTVEVTEKWHAEMERRGKAKRVAPQIPTTATAHCIGRNEPPDDPYERNEWMITGGGSTYKKETWTIGDDISAEHYLNFMDQTTGDLYVAYRIVDEEWQPRFVTASQFEAFKAVDSM